MAVRGGPPVALGVESLRPGAGGFAVPFAGGESALLVLGPTSAVRTSQAADEGWCALAIGALLASGPVQPAENELTPWAIGHALGTGAGDGLLSTLTGGVARVGATSCFHYDRHAWVRGQGRAEQRAESHLFYDVLGQLRHLLVGIRPQLTDGETNLALLRRGIESSDSGLQKSSRTRISSSVGLTSCRNRKRAVRICAWSTAAVQHQLKLFHTLGRCHWKSRRSGAACAGP